MSVVFLSGLARPAHLVVGRTKRPRAHRALAPLVNLRRFIR
ncbi:hypothetical protein [Microtetraspora niveoalba]|nr:hypothetical protein [Microtetraspora niveoalba]